MAETAKVPVHSSIPRFGEESEIQLEWQYKHGVSNSENPDKVISTKGMDYIEDLERDTHLTSVLNTRIQSVVAKGYSIKPYSRNGKVTARDAMLCDFVTDQLAGIPTFELDIVAMFDAISKWYSLTEIIVKMIGRGKWKGKIGLEELKFKAAKNFAFDFDKYGNYKLRQVESQKDLDLNKFIHYINGRDDHNPYGESLTSKCGFWIWLKKNFAKFSAIFGERFAMPFVKVELPNNVGMDSPEYQKAKELLEAILRDSGALVPDGFAVELLEAMRSGDAKYDYYLERSNKEVSKTFLGATLTSEEGKRGQGSFALGSVHAGVLNNYTLFDVIISASVINNQLIRRLIDWNFVTEHYPVFSWKVFDVSKVTVLAQNLQNLAEMLEIPVSFVYDYLGIPVPAPGDVTLKPASGEPAGGGGVDNKAQKAQREVFQKDKLAELVTIQKENIEENKAIEKQLLEDFGKAAEQVKQKLAAAKKLKEKSQAEMIQKAFVPVIEKILIMGDLQGRYHAKVETMQMDRLPAKFEEIYDPYSELIEEYINGGVLTRDEYEKLQQEMKLRSFSIAGVESEYVLEKVRDALADVTTEGGGWKEMVTKIDSIFKTAGIDPLKPYHLDTVIRTNLQTLYSRGRENIYKDLDEEDFPYKTVLSVLDDVVRPSHSKLHGFTRKLNDPIWQILNTPFDYNCRCTIIAVHKSQNFTESTQIPDLSELGFVNK